MLREGLVSVVIPVLNGVPYLAEAIESVLGQAHRPLEIVVVDDGSSDGSAELSERYRPQVTTIRQDNAGQSSARNRGVAAATGEFLAFLDADDRWTDGRLAAQLSRLQARPELDLVFGHVEQFVTPELTDRLPPLPESRRLMAGPHVGSMLIRRARFEQVGGFDEGMRVAEFVDWYDRARTAGLRSELLPQVVMQRRIHARNLGKSADGETLRRDYLACLQQIVKRRSLPAHAPSGERR